MLQQHSVKTQPSSVDDFRLVPRLRRQPDQRVDRPIAFAGPPFDQFESTRHNLTSSGLDCSRVLLCRPAKRPAHQRIEHVVAGFPNGRFHPRVPEVCNMLGDRRHRRILAKGGKVAGDLVRHIGQARHIHRYWAGSAAIRRLFSDHEV